MNVQILSDIAQNYKILLRRNNSDATAMDCYSNNHTKGIRMSTLLQASQSATDIIIKGQTFTNNGNLPKELGIFAAYHSTLYSGNPARAGKVSTTGIISPLRKLLLAIKHPEQPAKDVADLMASSKGTAMHEGMTRALTTHDSGYICEMRLEREINGWKISGEFDILTPNKQIKDLKHVSNYNLKSLEEDRSILDSAWSMEEMLTFVPTYAKFVLQLSIYRYLLNDEEILPYGSILFSLNNGSDMGKYKIDSEVTFPLFPNDAVEEFLSNRIQVLKEHLEADTLPFCTDVERGYRAGEWKLQRMGTTGKLATVRGSKCNSALELAAFIRSSGKPGDIESITEPSYIMCNYCNVRSVCTQV